MIITIIATTERLFDIIDKKHFRKGKWSEVLCRCYFLFVHFYYLAVLFLFFIKFFNKNVKETKYFEKNFCGLCCL